MSSPAVPRFEEPLPTPLRWAVRLLLGEAVAVGLIAAYLLYEDLTAPATDTRAAFALTGYAAIIAGALAGAGVTLSRRRAWGRGLAIALQLLLAAMGYYMALGGLAWLGVPAAALGLTVSGLLLTASTREALGIPR